MGQRFLIIGASGFVGARLFARLGSENVIATYCHQPFEGGIYFDAVNMRLADGVLGGAAGLTHAFILYGIAKLDQCARDPQGTALVNVDSIQRVVDDLLAAGITPVFTSSDAVFDGTRGMWTEEDPPNPILTYGKQKAAVERYLMGKGKPCVVARFSKVVGAEPDTHSLFGEWIRNIESGEPIRCAHDLVFTPIHVEDVVTALIAIAERRLSGIFNVCGPRSMTRLELLNLLLAHVRKYRDVKVEVIPCSIRDFPFLEPRPLNNSMLPDKLFSVLGKPCADMETVCARIAGEVYGRGKRQIHAPA